MTRSKGLVYRKRLTAKQEAFARNVALLFMRHAEAMRAAGYSEATINKKGAGFLMKMPAVVERIDALRSLGLDGAVSSLEQAFMRVSSIVEEALVTEATLMREAESETVRERAARSLLDVSKGLLSAVHPGSGSFTAVMEELYAEAMARKKRGVVDIEGGAVGEDSV